MVKRVSARVGRGLTLALALAAEGNAKVNEETWKKALAAHPEFSPHYEAAKGKFLDAAVERIARDRNVKSLMWLLERRHAELFRKDPDTVVNVSQSVGIPADVLERARELAGEEVGGGPKAAGESGAAANGDRSRSKKGNHGSA